MGKLQDQMAMDLALKSYTPQTCRLYLRCVRDFVHYFQRSPAQLGREEIRTYLHHLIAERQLSQAYVNQVYSGLKFFYETTLGRAWELTRIPRARQPKKIPVVLSRAELERLFAVPSDMKHRTLLVTMYSGGLRLSETTHLRGADIDSDRMQIRVHQGKGRKDRYTLLAQRTLSLLREYWRYERPEHWLFPGRSPEQPLSTRSVQKVMSRSLRRAEITKAASVHTLRHSFATHLLDAGVDLYHIQQLMGHKTAQTTAIYLHVTRRDLARIVSPFDQWASDDAPTV